MRRTLKDQMTIMKLRCSGAFSFLDFHGEQKTYLQGWNTVVPAETIVVRQHPSGANAYWLHCEMCSDLISAE